MSVKKCIPSLGQALQGIHRPLALPLHRNQRRGRPRRRLAARRPAGLRQGGGRQHALHPGPAWQQPPRHDDQHHREPQRRPALSGSPASDDTLRVNGRATIVRDDALAQVAVVNGKEPKVGIRVEVQEAFLHCAKAFKRSRLWDEESRQNRREMPSLGRMILEQTAPPEEPPSEETVKEADEFVEENYRTELY